eukprot:TRINITY_DN5666_c1_g1_i2.p1 TRINITY_DN5666_c1_g1~~TRINITY_DN5666_c1_g1_i2.p1  ORF type:complete len:251 (+),score=94.94 TRINITY_DN5666_c1_g1_i2:56-754(+)
MAEKAVLENRDKSQRTEQLQEDKHQHSQKETRDEVAEREDKKESNKHHNNNTKKQQHTHTHNRSDSDSGSESESEGESEGESDDGAKEGHKAIPATPEQYFAHKSHARKNKVIGSIKQKSGHLLHRPEIEQDGLEQREAGDIEMYKARGKDEHDRAKKAYLKKKAAERHEYDGDQDDKDPTLRSGYSHKVAGALKHTAGEVMRNTQVAAEGLDQKRAGERQIHDAKERHAQK